MFCVYWCQSCNCNFTVYATNAALLVNFYKSQLGIVHICIFSLKIAQFCDFAIFKRLDHSIKKTDLFLFSKLLQDYKNCKIAIKYKQVWMMPQGLTTVWEPHSNSCMNIFKIKCGSGIEEKTQFGPQCPPPNNLSKRLISCFCFCSFSFETQVKNDAAINQEPSQLFKLLKPLPKQGQLFPSIKYKLTFFVSKQHSFLAVQIFCMQQTIKVFFLTLHAKVAIMLMVLINLQNMSCQKYPVEDQQFHLAGPRK